MKDVCKQAVARALGKATLTAQEATDIEQRIIAAQRTVARQDITAWRNMSGVDRLNAAAKQVAIDIQEAFDRKKKIAAQDIVTQFKNLQEQQNHPNLSASDVLDRKVAFYADMSGVQSVEAKAKAIRTSYTAQVREMYDNVGGALGIRTDKVLVENVIRGLHKEKIDDPIAKKISEQLAKTFEDMRQRANRAGFDIRKLENWALPQIHDAEKLMKAKLDKWLADVMPLVKRDHYVKEDGTLMDDAELKDLFSYMYTTITTGGANKLQIGQANFSGTSKVTNRHSESRAIVFKDADSWLEYQNSYGGMPFVDLVDSHINVLSKEIALVEQFGSNPKMAFQVLKDAARKMDSDKGLKRKQIDKKLAKAESMLTQFVGIPTANETAANVSSGIRSLNIAALFGFLPISSIPDQAAVKVNANLHGIAYMKYAGRVMELIDPTNAEGRAMAQSFGAGVDEMIARINRFADDGLTEVESKSLAAAKAMNQLGTITMRASLQNFLSSAYKAAYQHCFMSKYADLSKKSWAELHENDRLIMQGTGLSERAWEVMRLSKFELDEKGRPILTARSIYEIPDEKILAAMDADVAKLVGDIQGQINELDLRNQTDDQRLNNRFQVLDETKKKISQKLETYINKNDAKSNAEKQYLQDQILLIDAKKEQASAQSDLSAYIRQIDNTEKLKEFFDGITQGGVIDKIAESAIKLGQELQAIDNKIAKKTERVNQKIASFEKEIAVKFNEFSKILDSKKKLTKQELATYEDKLSQRLNKYATRRDVIGQDEIQALNEIKDLLFDKKASVAKEFEISKAVEQTKLKEKTDEKSKNTVSKISTSNYLKGESIGKRIGNAERRITELNARIRQVDRSNSKAVDLKFKELQATIDRMDAEFLTYVDKVNERQQKRIFVIEKLNNSIDPKKKEFAQKVRDEIATQYTAHLLDEQGMAITEAGLREKNKMYGTTAAGSFSGEILRFGLQFKSIIYALIMRHGVRAISKKTGHNRATYAPTFIVLSTLLGGLSVQLKELAKGNDPLTVYDEDDPEKSWEFFKRSLVAGGGAPFLGDMVVAGLDPSGRSYADFLLGPTGSDIKNLLMATVGNAQQAFEGKETNMANEVYRIVKGKVPLQNLWYTTAATNRMIFDEIQDMLAPGYRERIKRKAEAEQGRTSWLGDDWGDIREPDFERVVE